MGVPGLWEILRKAGKPRSLTELAVVDGFDANRGGLRGFRIGIDASIWFYHAAYGREGENPELRTLFFRCATLMGTPFLPLFVFDGPKRPSVKRGKRIAGTANPLTTGMKAIIEAFGYEWRTAPGEAEAELAYLNRIGVIDGILSDDVDTFVFGAAMVIRNPSNNLSGNRSHPVLNSDGKDDKNHSMVYKMEDISNHPDINLTRGGLILIALLRGGDYHPEGLPGCGPAIAHGLCKSGFGNSLYQAALNLSEDELPAFLANWRTELCYELRMNTRGYLGRKNPSLAKSVPDNFPNIEILNSYVNPITSETMGRAHNNLKITWEREPDLGKLAQICEQYFEWGYKEAIIKRFRSVIWTSAVLRILRRGALNIDQARSELPLPSTPRKAGRTLPTPMGTPSKMIEKYFSSQASTSYHDNDDDDDDDKRLIVKIHSTRRHASTNGILEYRVEIAPAQLVRLTEAGIAGTRRIPDADEWADEEEDNGSGSESGKGKSKGRQPPAQPDSHLRMWMPATMMDMVEPGIVDAYKGALEKKKEKKTRAPSKKTSGKGKSRAATVERLEEDMSTDTDVLSVVTLTSTKISSITESVAGSPAPSNTLKQFYGVRKTVKAVGAKPKMSVPGRAAKPAALKRNLKPPSQISESEDNVPAFGSFTSSKASSRPTKPPSVYLEISDDDESTPRAPPPKLQPFPMTAADFIPIRMQDFFSTSSRPARTASPSFAPSRGPHEKASSNSDPDAPYPPMLRAKKTSRTSAEQTSPRTQRAATGSRAPHASDSENWHAAVRPGSPSPMRPVVRKTLGGQPLPRGSQPLAVIEISSDSDDDPPPLSSVLPPLMLARTKAKERAASKQPTKSLTQAKTKRAGFTISDVSNIAREVIDLT